MTSEIKISPFQCKLKHLRMLQGMKVITSLENTRSGRSDMDGFFTYTNHSHQSASKMMNFLVEECHRDSPFIFFEWLWVIINASWTLSMWLAHCCPIRRGVFCFQERIVSCIMIYLSSQGLVLIFKNEKWLFAPIERKHDYCLVWNSKTELKTSF